MNSIDTLFDEVTESALRKTRDLKDNLLASLDDKTIRYYGYEVHLDSYNVGPRHRRLYKVRDVYHNRVYDTLSIEHALGLVKILKTEDPALIKRFQKTNEKYCRLVYEVLCLKHNRDTAKTLEDHDVFRAKESYKIAEMLNAEKNLKKTLRTINT